MTKIEKESQQIYPTYYNLLIGKNFWQAHYQVLSIVFPKVFIKLNVNSDAMIKNVKLLELNTKIESTFLNTKTLNMI